MSVFQVSNHNLISNWPSINHVIYSNINIININNLDSPLEKHCFLFVFPCA